MSLVNLEISYGFHRLPNIFNKKKPFTGIEIVSLTTETHRDLFKVDFIVQAYTSENKSVQEYLANSGSSGARGSSSSSSSGGGAQYVDDDAEEGAAAVVPSDADQQIQSVQDVLPHLQRDFVQQLLTRYESVELAIAAVLEGNLPPDLVEAAACEKVAEQQVPAASPPSAKASILEEYSHRGRPAVLVKSGKGFPGAPKTMKALLDDKSHVRSLRTRYEEYGLVPEGDYDDEYDDSYDAMAETETKCRKAVAYGVESESEEEIEETTEPASGDQSQQRDKGRDFCENPEAIRERWAQNRNNRQAARRPASAKPQYVLELMNLFNLSFIYTYLL